jgi:L-rhamnose mutarotase
VLHSARTAEVRSSFFHSEAKERIVMIRQAFKMKIKPGFEQEYKRRHDEIWPVLVKELEAAGVSDYSIYLDEETLTLFAFQKLKDHNASAALPETEIVKKWWSYMSDIMETNPDHSPMSTTLPEVFHMD